MKIRFFAWMMLVLTLALGVAAAEEGDLLAQIQSRGEIVVATEGAWAPWTYHDEENQLVGFDVEVARAIAQKLCDLGALHVLPSIPNKISIRG